MKESEVVEHLLCVLATNSDLVPTRICGLLAQRNVRIDSIQMARSTETQHWWIQVVVCVDSAAAVELTVKRLNRLVDVVKVVDVSAEPSHHRRSMFVIVRPAPHELIHVAEIARLFGAEVLEVTPVATSLYVSASPSRCAEFRALLAPYRVVEAVPGAVTGIRTGTASAFSRGPQVVRSSRPQPLTSARLNA